MRIENISRRDMLKGMAGLSGLVLSGVLTSGPSAWAEATKTA